MEEICESADTCQEPETHDEFAWDDVNNCNLDPARVREARRAEMEYFQRLQVYQEVPVQKSKDVTGKMLVKVRSVDKQVRRNELQAPQSGGRKRVKAVQ